MNKKVITLIIIIAALLLAVPTVALLRSSSNPTSTSPPLTSAPDDRQDTNEQATQPAQENTTGNAGPDASSSCPEAKNQTITAENGGFSPSCITISGGTEITWKNNGSQEIQIGVDPHPSHSGNQQLTNNKFVLPIKAGQSTTSNIPAAGEYKYHDHLNPTASGTVIVR